MLWNEAVQNPRLELLSTVASSPGSRDTDMYAIEFSPLECPKLLQLDSSDEDIAVVNERPMQPGNRGHMDTANGLASGPASAGKESWRPL